jgi:hypothetical protein
MASIGSTLRRGITATAVLAAALGGGGLLTACGSGSDASTPAVPPAPTPSSTPSSTSSTPTSTTTPTTTTTTTSSESPDPPAGPDACKADELNVSLQPADGGGAGSSYPALRFTNTGQRTCTLQGSPGVSFVAGDNGNQVGKPATRQPKEQGQVVTLAPGNSAVSPVRITNAENYGPDCKPVQARGLRVYAPGDTTAMFVNKPQTVCTAIGDTQLSVEVIR